MMLETKKKTEAEKPSRQKLIVAILSTIVVVGVCAWYLIATEVDLLPFRSASSLAGKGKQADKAAIDELERRYVSGQLSEEEKVRFFESAASFALVVRTPCLSGKSIACEFRAKVPLDGITSAHRFHLSDAEVLVDGEPVKSKKPKKLDWMMWEHSNSAQWAIAVNKLEPGKHEIGFKGKLSIHERGNRHADETPLLYEYPISLQQEIEVIEGRAKDLVKSVCKPAEKERINKQFRLSNFMDSGEPALARQKVLLVAATGTLPAPIAANVYVRKNGTKKYLYAGKCLLNASRNTWLELKWPKSLSQPTLVDMRFAPSAEVAMQLLPPDAEEYCGCVIEKKKIMVAPRIRMIPQDPRNTQDLRS